ncbi:MAG TPA: hypothetical protein VGD88_13550 [Opitutaceae bacterium]
MKTDLRACGLIALHGVRVSVRQRLFIGVGAAVLVFAWLALELRAFHFGGGEVRLVADLAVAAWSIGGLAVTLMLTLGHLGGECGHRARTALLSKALAPRAFVAGHWLAVMIGVGLFVVLMLGVTAGLMLRTGGPDARVPWATLVQVGLLTLAKGGVVAAAVMLVCGLVRSGALAGWLAVLLVVAGQLRGVFAALPERMQIAGPVVARVIEFVVPDLALFDRGGALGAGQRIEWTDTAWLGAYAGLYAAGFLALAIQVFRRREI